MPGVAEAQVGGRSVAVRHETDPADLTVTADPGRLAQLVANLVDNAVRHSPPQGEVRVSARAVDDDTWWLEVCDDGPGIPADQLERVFDRFGSGGDSGGGTGLGLAIASWVCELHGGTITALPTPTGTSGAHLRAVLPRRARAGRPTHLQEDRTVPTSTTPTSPPPTSPAPPASGRRRRPSWHPAPPARPAEAPSIDALWPEKGVPVQPLAVLAALGIGTWAALTWPRAQRRARRSPSPCSPPACSCGSSPGTGATRGPSAAPCSQRCSPRRR